MGQFTAYRCDWEECSTIKETNNGVPKGWLSLVISGVNGAIVVCSNECMAHVAVERYEAEHNTTWGRKKVKGTTRISTPASVASARRASNVNWHNQGKHTTPREGCPKCEPAQEMQTITA